LPWKTNEINSGGGGESYHITKPSFSWSQSSKKMDFTTKYVSYKAINIIQLKLLKPMAITFDFRRKEELY
jgi:hypothetical protein